MNVTHLRSDLYHLTDIVDGLLCLTYVKFCVVVDVKPCVGWGLM